MGPSSYPCHAPGKCRFHQGNYGDALIVGAVNLLGFCLRSSLKEQEAGHRVKSFHFTIAWFCFAGGAYLLSCNKRGHAVICCRDTYSPALAPKIQNVRQLVIALVHCL